MRNNWDPDTMFGQILTMDLGHHIGVWVPIPDAERLFTIRDVKEYLSERLCRKKESPCPSQHAFYRLRRALVDLHGVERSSVRPSAQWGDVLPRWRARRAWKGIENATGSSNAPLRWSSICSSVTLSPASAGTFPRVRILAEDG